MAIVKLPVYLKIGKNDCGSPCVIGATGWNVVLTPGEKLIHFEVEVDDEWINPAIPTGITLQIGVAGVLNPKQVVKGLHDIQREMEKIDPS